MLHDNSEVAGYISGNMRGDPNTAERFIHVNHICVMPQHRNSGIGGLLWDAFLLHFESQEQGSTQAVQLEVYVKNEIARKWYLSLGFEDLDCNESCRAMRRSSEADAVVRKILEHKAVAKACRLFPQLLNQVRPQLDILVWDSIVAKLEEQVKKLLDAPNAQSASQALELGGLFSGSWHIKVNGSSKLWGRAFVGPLGIGFFDVKLPGVNQGLSLQAIRIDGVGSSAADGPFVVSNALLAQRGDETLQWEWSRNGSSVGSSVWTRDPDAALQSPLPSSAPAPGATIADEFRRAVQLLRKCVGLARSHLWPIPESLSKEAQDWLSSLLERRVRLPMAKLQEIEKKLDRLERRYSGADFLKRNSSEMSEYKYKGSEKSKSMKTGIKKLRSMPPTKRLRLIPPTPIDQ
jgi:hypothetical protein